MLSLESLIMEAVELFIASWGRRHHQSPHLKQIWRMVSGKGSIWFRRAAAPSTARQLRPSLARNRLQGMGPSKASPLEWVVSWLGQDQGIRYFLIGTRLTECPRCAPHEAGPGATVKPLVRGFAGARPTLPWSRGIQGSEAAGRRHLPRCSKECFRPAGWEVHQPRAPAPETRIRPLYGGAGGHESGLNEAPGDSGVPPGWINAAIRRCGRTNCPSLPGIDYLCNHDPSCRSFVKGAGRARGALADGAGLKSAEVEVQSYVRTGVVCCVSTENCAASGEENAGKAVREKAANARAKPQS